MPHIWPSREYSDMMTVRDQPADHRHTDKARSARYEYVHAVRSPSQPSGNS